MSDITGKTIAIIAGVGLFSLGWMILHKKTTEAAPTGVEVTWDSGLGDVDQDGIVSTADIGLVKAIILGKIIPTDEEFRRADVNQDGKVNATDIAYIKAILEGNYIPE